MNAVSDAWFSKYVGRNRVSELSEKILEFISECEMHTLNVLSQQYTYSGPAGKNDIDLSLGEDRFKVWMEN